MGEKRNGDCVNTNLPLNEADNLSRTVEQFWAMEIMKQSTRIVFY